MRVLILPALILVSGCSGKSDPTDSGTQKDSADSGQSGETGDSGEPSDTSETGTPSDTGDTGVKDTSGADRAAAVDAFVTAALAFRADLDSTQLGVLSFDLDHEERTTWNNVPADIVARLGMSFGEMSDTQYALAKTMFEAGFSGDGWQRAENIIAAEAYNQDVLGDPVLNPDLYYVTMFDEPSTVDPWGLQFDGHHMVANFTVVGDRFDIVPAFWGVAPTTLESGKHKGLEPLVELADTGLAFMQSLGKVQDQAWIQTEDLEGILTGPGDDDKIPEAPVGLPGSEMDSDQRAAFMELIAVYVGQLQADQAQARMAEIEASLEETYFAWFGSLSTDNAWDYRIQGPEVWIEFDHVSSDHIHSIYRDPENDYGANWLADHKTSHPHP